ncbi:hypothetical protein [Flavobacterium hercynium]|uniref:DUF4421 domain-containing protein n=1 Tax=Flavobacterium hercynium TaxID=387094 RepID=A0A226H1B2_9FLAO|nr:hypothetical protein [Flavobacterium hercynium]OXA87280.1 hypothetical protein B0A66_16845 [Flavobacterium hercynium]SMP19628.1 hypothetical protein SAMN06265346_10651 [Flavobacterium hercynium]
MKYYFLFLFFLIFTFPSLAQLSKDDFWNAEIENSSDIVKPYLLSTHPLGIYISRLHHNFNVRSPDKYSFSFDVSSGNVVLPYVKSYELTNPEDREASENLPWYNREYAFNLNQVPSKIKEFSADGVIRSYRFTFTLPITTYHELNFSLRANSLDRGKYPFSVFTSDASIEWFHRNIAGGKDPFSRYHYGINKAGIAYKDENGKVITMNNNDFIIPGIDINYNFYPKLEMNKKHHIYLNFGAQLGINTSKYNPSTDLGISSSILKKMIFKDKNILSFGFSAGALRQHFIEYGDRVNISNQKFLYSFEGLVNYQVKLKNSNRISYSINYNFQSAYNNKKDADYLVLTGERVKTHWQTALSHLYEDLEGWNFMCTYSTKRFSYFVYLREDIKVDNAPDLQTGIGVKMSIKKS